MDPFSGILICKQLQLTKSSVKKANFVNADLKEANLQNSNYLGAKFTKADLRGADLRDAKNVCFDESLIEGVLLSPNSDEPWTVLRREYTGSKILFHLLLLIAFLIPLVSKTFF